ncbi:MAG: adenylate/guanylate cyclase domain-containing protein [Candidatus Wallbacteria bacterium]|nr:adenylate/guanylate cyclase domain-containing protein [Candidatus Wallbacteria bacterium]
MENRVLTIMFTDIKGFTARTSSSSREELHNLLNKHEDILLPIVKKFNGRLIKTIGDALLVVFESPTNAVLCGLMMQEALWDHNKGKNEEDRIFVRVSINTGEVELKDGDVFGEAVNIASRLEGITEVNEIYFTESVYLAMNKAEVPTSEVGQRILKGLPEPIKVYKVIQDRTSADFQDLITKIKSGDTARAEKSFSWTPVVIGALFLAAFGCFYLLRDNPEKRVKEIDKALQDGKLDLALNRADEAYRDFPGSELAIESVKKVVRQEVAPLMAKQKFEEAQALLDKRQSEHPKISLQQIWKERLLEEARWYYDHGNGNGRYDYEALLTKFDDDLALQQEFLQKFGAGSKEEFASSMIYDVALAVAEKTGKVDDLAGKTMLQALRYDLENTKVKNAIPLLVEKYPPVLTFALDNLATMENHVRFNCREILRKTNQYNSTQELIFNFYNLISIDDNAQADDLQKAITCFKGYQPGSEFDSLKQNLGLLKITDLKSANLDLNKSGEIMEIITSLFYPQALGMFQEWAAGDCFYLRLDAYQVFEKKGELSRINLWDFHTRNITQANPRDSFQDFQTCLDLALKFFVDQLKTDQKDKALKVLSQSIDHFNELLADFEKSKFDFMVKALPEMIEKVKAVKEQK